MSESVPPHQKRIAEYPPKPPLCGTVTDEVIALVRQLRRNGGKFSSPDEPPIGGGR